MVKDCLFFLVKFSSYMPMVLLPLFIYKEFNNVFLIGISLALWRMLSYYKYNVIHKTLQKYIVRASLILILIVDLLYPVNLKYNVLLLIFISSLLSSYLRVEPACLRENALTNFIFIVSGMIAAGLIMYNLRFLSFYFNIFNIALLLVGRISPFEKIKRCSFKVFKYDLITVFLHNFIYYFFIFSIPLIMFELTGSYYITGVAVSFNWMLFIPRYYIINLLKKYIDIRYIIAVGFLISSSLFVIIAAYIKNQIIILCSLLFHGISGGISEGFWDIEYIRKETTCYWDTWKVGGILGGITGSFIVYYLGFEKLFFISALLAFICVTINFYLAIKSQLERRDAK